MKVEIWADVVCPWCYLGKRRFDAALASFDAREDVEVVHRSFELDPTMDVTAPLAEHLSSKYGVDLSEARQMQSRVSSLGAEAGIAYRFDLARTANTFDAHRLVHHASANDAGEQMLERLYAAYFTEGASITDTEVLHSLGTQVGLDGAALTTALAGDDYADAVRTDERTAAELGITGVPFFVADRRLGVSGAQSGDVFTQFLHQAAEAA